MDVPRSYAAVEADLRRSWKGFRALRPFVPPDARSDFAALCAWHGEVRRAEAQGAGALARLSSELEDALAPVGPGARGGRAETPLAIALGHTLRRRSLPPNLLRNPLSARSQGLALGAFQTDDELRTHARRIATGEGRLLVRLLGRDDERADLLADALAVGLQLGLWCVGLRRDVERGLLRLSVENLQRSGVPLGSLREAVERSPQPLRDAVAAQVESARAQLAKGWALCHTLGPVRGRALAGFLRWRAAAMSSLEARRFRLAAAGDERAGVLRFAACTGAAAATRSAPRFQSGAPRATRD